MLSFGDSPGTLGNGYAYDITVDKTSNSVSKRTDRTSSDASRAQSSGFRLMESYPFPSEISVFLYGSCHLVAHSLCFDERAI